MAINPTTIESPVLVTGRNTFVVTLNASDPFLTAFSVLIFKDLRNPTSYRALKKENQRRPFEDN
jgi:hypothetical protein